MFASEIHVVEAPLPPPLPQTADYVGEVGQNLPIPSITNQPPVVMPPVYGASQGLAQMFGLDARAAVATVLIDLMVFGTDTFSFETLLPLGILIAGVLGFIVYKTQRKWYGDDHDSALIKSMLIFILTAIPVPLSPFLAVPAGLIGIYKKLRGK